MDGSVRILFSVDLQRLNNKGRLALSDMLKEVAYEEREEHRERDV